MERQSMNRRTLLVLLASAMMSACVAEVRDEPAVDAPADAADAVFELVTGEMIVARLDEPADVDMESMGEGIGLVAEGLDLAIVARAPGEHTAQLGNGRLVTVRVLDGVPEDDEYSQLHPGLGLGQEVSIDAAGIKRVLVFERAGVHIKPTPKGDALVLRPMLQGRHDVMLVTERGIERVVLDSLPRGVVPEGAEERALVVGAEGHSVDLRGVSRVSIAREEVVRVQIVEGSLAVIEPVGVGLTPVTFYRKEGEPRVLWFRVTE